jgi:hypothetical protein
MGFHHLYWDFVIQYLFWGPYRIFYSVVKVLEGTDQVFAGVPFYLKI